MIKNIFRKGREESVEGSPVVAGEAKGRILVVDDSPTEIHIFKRILEKQGYQILVAKDGQEGVEIAKQELPDLILMDVVMPVLNGFQAAEEFRYHIEHSGHYGHHKGPADRYQLGYAPRCHRVSGEACCTRGFA